MEAATLNNRGSKRNRYTTLILNPSRK